MASNPPIPVPYNIAPPAPAPAPAASTSASAIPANRDPNLTTRGRPRKKRVRTVTGCLVCRQRRVKCDERKPRCSNCARHPHRVCEYPFQVETKAEGGGRSDEGDSAGGDRERESEDRSVSAIDDMSLMLSSPASGDEPYVPAAHLEMLLAHAAASLMEAQRVDNYLLSPIGSNAALADSLIAKLPVDPTSQFRTILDHHATLVRRSFTELDDAENRLLCSSTALLAANASSPSFRAKDGEDRRNGLLSHYLGLVHRKTATIAPAAVPPVNGKLGATGFTLFLSQVTAPLPGKWREQLKAGVEWALARGGPGWVIGVTPPNPGYRGGDLRILEPLGMAVYSDFTALLAVLAALTDGTQPAYVTLDPSWLLASRALQVKLAPALPDLFEAVLFAPRILIPTLGRAVGLAARRAHIVGQSDLLAEQLEHDAAALRAELEYVWPARLAARPDTRSVQYGARAWRLAVLVLLMHQAQQFVPSDPDVVGRVSEFINLSCDALADLGALDGWLWPILIIACAALGDHRAMVAALLAHARTPVGERDLTAAYTIIARVHAAHDMGKPYYHIKDAVEDDASLDVLLL